LLIERWPHALLKAMGGDHGHAHDQGGSGGHHGHSGHDEGHGHGRADGHSHGGHGHGHDDGPSHGGHGHGHDDARSHGGNDLEAPLLGAIGINKELLEEQNKLRRAVYFSLFMMFVEIFGGILANSLAIITDAAHMLSDVGGFIVSLVCLQLAVQGVTEEYTYGFKQAEVLGALLSVTIVWALTAGLLLEAFHRFYDLQEINAPYMLGISTLGFFVNMALMKVLGHGHSHGDGGHGHSHGNERGHGGVDGGHAQEEASLAMKAALAHVLGDIVQSLGVCVAALLILLQPFDIGVTDNGVSKWNYADPMCTVLFGVLVLTTTKATLKQTIDSLMVKAPPHIDQIKLADRLNSLPHVESVHDLHVWAIGSKDVLCTAHLQIRGLENSTESLKKAIKVAQGMGIYHSTFQIEIAGEFDPALESYGFHDNPVSSPSSGSPRELRGERKGEDPGHGHGHGHDEGRGHGHDEGHGGHGHSH